MTTLTQNRIQTPHAPALKQRVAEEPFQPQLSFKVLCKLSVV